MEPLKMEYPRYEAALFDLDGVLIDTEGIYSRFWDDMGRRYNKQPTFANDIKGTTLSDILAKHFPADKHREIEESIHLFEDSMPFEFFPGVENFLRELHAMAIPMAIVTSSDDAKMRALGLQLPGLLELMDAVIDGSMVTCSKPHPEGYLLAASKLHASPSKCVVFEDSLQGLEAGRRAGATVAGLVTTNPADKVLPLCDFAIYSWLEVSPAKLRFSRI